MEIFAIEFHPDELFYLQLEFSLLFYNRLYYIYEATALNLIYSNLRCNSGLCSVQFQGSCSESELLRQAHEDTSKVPEDSCFGGL